MAIDLYGKAALIWTSLSDYSNASAAELKAGDVCFQLSEYPEALKHFHNAARLGRQTGDRLSEGRALSRMGRVYSYLGDNDLARSTLAKALTLLERRQPNPTSLVSHAHAEALSHRAEVIYCEREPLKVTRITSKTPARGCQKTVKAEPEHTCLAVHSRNHRSARKGYVRDLRGHDFISGSGDKAGEGLALTALGFVYSGKGQEQEAIKLPSRSD